jgi:membrane-associated phospholipid phosphatase
VFYGYVPALLILFAFLDIVVRPLCYSCGIGTRELAFLLFVIFQVSIGEGIIKKLFKVPRPEQSCCTTCGMPSSHSTISVGLFALLLLDALWRSTNGLDDRTWSMSRRRIEVLGRVSFACTRNLSLRFVLCWGAILLPVPLTRVALHDHTLAQVVIGSAIGCAEAILFWTFLQSILVPKVRDRVGKYACKNIIYHSLGL